MRLSVQTIICSGTSSFPVTPLLLNYYSMDHVEYRLYIELYQSIEEKATETAIIDEQAFRALFRPVRAGNETMHFFYAI